MPRSGRGFNRRLRALTLAFSVSICVTSTFFLPVRLLLWVQGSMPEPDFLTSLSSTVNNAGKSYQYPEDFSACSEKDMEDIVTINVGSVVRLTRMVLPGMVERYV